MFIISLSLTKNVLHVVDLTQFLLPLKTSVIEVCTVWWDSKCRVGE